MHRTIKIAATATLAAAALIGTATAASANVSYDNASIGTVDKSDVQILFGWNDKTLQTKVAEGAVSFTSKYQMDSTDVWSCSDGTTESRTSRVTQSRVLNVTPIKNTSADKVTGFTLNGIDETKGGTYLGGTRFGAPYVGYCATGAFTGFLPHEFVNTVLPGVQVNGVDLRVTPVAAPAA